MLKKYNIQTHTQYYNIACSSLSSCMTFWPFFLDEIWTDVAIAQFLLTSANIKKKTNVISYKYKYIIIFMSQQAKSSCYLYIMVGSITGDGWSH